MFKLKPLNHTIRILSALTLSAIINGCSDSNSVESSDIQKFNVSGSIVGLNGSVTLKNGNDPDMTLRLDGDISIAKDIPTGTTYNIQVTTQPDNQFCEVINGSGIVTENINNIQINCNEVLFITANDNSLGGNYELWATAGTPASTYKVKEINPNGSSVSFDQIYTSFNGKHYFSADNGSLGRELWRTDGTEDGTILIKNINVANGNLSSTPSVMNVVGNKMVFYAFTDTQGTVSHSMDEFENVSFLSNRTIYENNVLFDNKLLFESFSLTLSEAVIHTTDGITLEEKLFNSNYAFSPARITLVDNKLFYFTFNNGGNVSLWVTEADGSSSPIELKTFSGISSNRVVDDTEMQVVSFQGKLFFSADDSNGGYTLWKSDGTVSGTQKVKDLDNSLAPTEVIGLRVLNNQLIFQARGTAAGLWSSDGTDAGTTKLSAAILQLGNFHGVSYPVIANNKYFYQANDSVNGNELWVSDGTSSGTKMVKNINPTGDSFPLNLISRNGYILFGASASDEQGFELWRSDGTENGTTLVKEFCLDSECSGFAGPPAG